MPIQPGRMLEEPTVPSPCSIGPGRPMPAPITCARFTPASASVSETSSAAASSPSWASWSVSSGRVRSARIVEARSDTATRRCEWPKSMPTAAPADASKESRIGGRPPCAPCAEPGSGRSTTSPSACRSATRLDTVERDNPVRRAMSAREIWPSSRSARITRRRFRRRSDSSDPARLGGMRPAIVSGPRPVCQRFGRTGRHHRPLTVRVDGHHDVAGELVLPALILLVPEHPEVAEEERNGRQDPADLADEPPPIADRAALAEVVHPDPQGALAERLAGLPALEIGEVAPVHDGRKPEVEAVLEDDPQDQVDDEQQDQVHEVRREPAPEAGARAARPAGLRFVGRRRRLLVLL